MLTEIGLCPVARRPRGVDRGSRAPPLAVPLRNAQFAGFPTRLPSPVSSIPVHHLPWIYHRSRRGVCACRQAIERGQTSSLRPELVRPLRRGVGASDAASDVRRSIYRSITSYNVGIIKSVSSVAGMRPPATTVAMLRCTSLPTPVASAAGSMPSVATVARRRFRARIGER